MQKAFARPFPIQTFKGSPSAGWDVSSQLRQVPHCSVSGFLPVEGPYPQWDLPKVMWRMHDAASAKFPNAKAGAATLRMRARSPYADQSIDVSLNDQHVSKCELSAPSVFVACSFQVNVSHLPPVVKLQFAKTGSLDGGRTVLFTDLTLKADK